MTTQEALDIKKALLTLSDALNLDFNQVAARVCLLDDDKGAILKQASDLWNEFDDASMVDRGKMLGIEITEVTA